MELSFPVSCPSLNFFAFKPIRSCLLLLIFFQLNGFGISHASQKWFIRFPFFRLASPSMVVPMPDFPQFSFFWDPDKVFLPLSPPVVSSYFFLFLHRQVLPSNSVFLLYRIFILGVSHRLPRVGCSRLFFSLFPPHLLFFFRDFSSVCC